VEPRGEYPGSLPNSPTEMTAIAAFWKLRRHPSVAEPRVKKTPLLHAAERICDLVSILERVLLRLFGFGLFLHGLISAVRRIVGW